MFLIHSNTTRIFVWLAAIAIPLQGLPTAACSCTQATVCASEVVASQCSCTGAKVCQCGETSACCQPKTSCCSSKTSIEAGCQCGDQCHCGESSVPSKPTAPPVENSSPERIVTDAAATALFGAVYLSSTTRQHWDLSAGAHALTAHDCCVSLCRFTL